MAQFPTLKTGALAQYPSTVAQSFRTEIISFLDGSEQRFRCSPSPLHRWTIDLSQLDEQELAKIEEFFVVNRGDATPFAFVDPWTGNTFPNCSIDGDRIQSVYDAVDSGSVQLIVRENRT